MAKAKRERRSSIRTLPADAGHDILDRLDQLERQEKASPPDDAPAPAGEDQNEEQDEADGAASAR